MVTRFITSLVRSLNRKDVLALLFGIMVSAISVGTLFYFFAMPIFLRSKPKLRIELSPRELYEAGDAQLNLKRFRIYNEGKEIAKDLHVSIYTSADIERLQVTSRSMFGMKVYEPRKRPGGTEFRHSIRSLFPGTYTEFVLIVTGPAEMEGRIVVEVLGEYGDGRFVGESVAERL